MNRFRVKTHKIRKEKQQRSSWLVGCFFVLFCFIGGGRGEEEAILSVQFF